MLSKSNILSYLQCARKLWLEQHEPELASPEGASTRRRKNDGNLVGGRARDQLGEDLLRPPVRDDQTVAAEEAKSLLLRHPGSPAAEVPMAHGGLYARTDALIPEGGGYVLQETKASSFPLKSDKVTPGKPKEHHLDDLAIQAWVMSQSGIPMQRAELNLLNNRWRYPGGGDYSGLFRQLDATADMRDRVDQVPGWLDGVQSAIKGDKPEVRMAKQCHSPYECPFQNHCRTLEPPGPDHPIELLPDAAGKLLARKLREKKGYLSILDPSPEELTGSQKDLYRRIQEAHRSGQAVIVPGSAKIIERFPYPRYYFDFEGIDLPVPVWPGVRPYEQIPFQWSCHIERAPGVFEHAEFLDLTGGDPSLPCIQRMEEIIDQDDDGPIFVYFAAYEKTRLRELSERHSRYADLVEKYLNRVVDLLPLVKQHFYHPHMCGSFSMKKVLPAIAPDLDYGALDGVQEGTAAQIAYLEAALNEYTPEEDKARLEQELRRYCRQDTWALVEIAHFLAQRGRPSRPPGM